MTESPSTETVGTGSLPVSSSLSADAAEFVPSNVPLPNGLNKNGQRPQHMHASTAANVPGWKDKQGPVLELPSFLTSCYPFVQPNGSVRPAVNRFPAPFRVPGNLAFQGMPMSVPVASSPWTQPSPLVPPAKVLVSRFPPPRQLGESFTSPDTISSAELPPNGLMSNPHSVPITPQATPTLVMNPLTYPDFVYPWMTEPRPPFFHPHQMSKPPPSRLPNPFVPPPQAVCPTPPPVHGLVRPQMTRHSFLSSNSTAVPTTSISPTSSANLKSRPLSSSSSVMSSQKKRASASTTTHSASLASDKNQTNSPVSGGGQSNKSLYPSQSLDKPVRPTSPVLISRSAQTDFPLNFRLMSVKELPHELFRDEKVGTQKSQSENEVKEFERSSHSVINTFCVGVQISALKTGFSDSQDSQTNSLNVQSVSFWKEKVRLQSSITNKSALKSEYSSSPSKNAHVPPASSPCKDTTTAELLSKEKVKDKNTNENEKDTAKENPAHRKKRSRKKHQRDGTRSPGRIGSSRLLSRSSSSISSAGAREDDEKIDLHSWTDFPPMNTRTGSSNIAARTLTSDNGAPIQIQRSQDAPPWTIKDSVDFGEEGKENVSSQQGHLFSHQKSQDSAEKSAPVNSWAELEGGHKNNWKTGPPHVQTKNNPGHSQSSSHQKVPQALQHPKGSTFKSQSPQPLQPQHKNQLSSSTANAQAKNYSLAMQSNAARSNPNHLTQKPPSGPRDVSFSPSQPQKQSSDHQHQQQSHSRHNFQAQQKSGDSQTHEPSSFHPLIPVPTLSESQSQTKSLSEDGSLSNIINWPTISSTGRGTFSETEKSNQNNSRTLVVGLGGESGSKSENRTENRESNREEDKNAGDNKTRRRRHRNRTRQNKGKSPHGVNRSDHEVSGDDYKNMDRTVSNSNASEMTLHFEDVDEFPDLLWSSRGLSQEAYPNAGGERSTLSGTSLSYSDIIKSHSNSRPHSLTGSCVSGDNEEDVASNFAESKRARKRRKRREEANKAAETELAEISLEQRLLKEGLKKSVGATPGIISDALIVKEAKKQGGGGGKKSKEPITFNIAAMLDAMQKKNVDTLPSSTVTPPSPTSSRKGHSQKSPKGIGSHTSINLLDSSGPVQKRGKERETAKPKKPSPLKKVILKEREEKKRLRLLDGGKEDMMGTTGGIGMLGTESELSQDALSSKSEGTEGAEQLERAELSADLSPISQTSPISMSPASPGNSGVNSPVTGSVGRDPVVMKIHSRRFREYCTQILDKEIDQCCTALLQDLVRFQDRMYHKDPVKAKSKRRLVLGLREVTKHLRLKKIKCVVISPNLEKIQSKGGLDEALNKILSMCQEQNVPFVFALGRRALGRACAKLVPVSVVGVFNFDGCEDKYHTLVALTANARTTYHEMVAAVEREVAQHASTMAWQAPSISGVSSLLPAHMGHSRTPSGCSAISFTSSIMSEPHSEFNPSNPDEQRLSEVNHSAGGPRGTTLTNDIDDGNEADIEDFGEAKKKRRGLRGSNSVRFGEGSSDDRTTGENGGGIGSAGAGIGANSSGVVNNSGNNNNNNNSSNNNMGAANGAVDMRPHHHHHNLHHHRRQSSVSSLARIIEGIDDEVTSKPSGTADNKAKDKTVQNNDPASSISHIDSIHNPLYKLESEILPNPGSRTASWEDGPNENVDGNGDVNNDDDDDDDEIEKGNGNIIRGHTRQRSMDKKERIKNWLESQSNIPLGDS